MSVLWLLIGASTLVALGFLIAFIRAVMRGQFDDRHTPAVRILFEDMKKKSDITTTSVSSHVEGPPANGDADSNLR